MAEVKIKEIVRQRRKTLSMSVNPDATLTIKAPFFTPMPFIQKFIEKNEVWIRKQIKVVEAKPKAKKHRFIDGEEFLYLGKLYPLKIGHYPLITINNSIYFPVSKSGKVRSKLLEWYKSQALEIIRSRVDHFAERMGVSYRSIRITQAETRWGSCSHNNNLRFNWKLVMTPLEIIDYVVVHEMAHIVHKNHSQRFWIAVRNFIPDAKRRIKWLKVHGRSLNI